MKRNLFSFLVILLTLGIIVAVAFGNADLANAWGALFTMDWRWVLAALLGWFVYMFFDMLGTRYYLSRNDHPISLRYALYITLIGFYYTNITPAALGGQPMQVYYLSKRKVPVAIGTSMISIKFFAQQLMVVLLATSVWLGNAAFVQRQLGGVTWAIWIGYILNFASIPLILLAALHRPLIQAVVNFLIRLGARLKIVKRPEDTILRVSSGLDVYHASMLRLGKHPGQLIGQLLLAGTSLLGLMSVSYSVYRAFGLSGTPWYDLLTVAILLCLSASHTPLPKASGAQEGNFLVFYHGIFTQGTIGLGLLVWRFCTYYLFLLIGMGMMIVSNVRAGRLERAAKAAARAGGPSPNAPAAGPVASATDSAPIAPEEANAAPETLTAFAQTSASARD